MKASKFYSPPPFRERVTNFFQSILFWRGRRKGIIHTINIKWEDIRAVFFPRTFHEKYIYLGCVPWDETGPMYSALEPLVIFMDYKAKPWWCPRWFLRFLHLFGNDNSMVRVRNRTLHNLSKKLTKGYFIWDYKTKWHWYDLRISISGTEQMWSLVDAIENKYYYDGYKIALVEQIEDLDPNTTFNENYSVDTLKAELERLEKAE